MSMIELNVLTDSLIPLEVMGGGSGGITPIGTKQISITENGTYTEDVYDFANAEIDVNVPIVTPTGTKSISIVTNGTTTEDVENYADAEITVNVPNTYTASDEGKVVNNGALTSQTSATYTENDTYDTTLIDEVTVNVDTVNNQNKTVVPSESVQSITADEGYTGLGEVTVDGIPTNYVGSAVPRKASADLTVSGATVNVPSGYYSASASKSVNSGSEGTPTATKGTVANHSVDITPSVTNVEGYIQGGTKNGSAVKVSASELVSGTLEIDSSGTKDVTNYKNVSVPSGSEGTPVATKGAVSNHSVDVTPSVTNAEGYIAGGTKSGTAVNVSASELVSGSETKTANGTYDVTNLASVIVDVDNSYTASDEGKVVSNGALVAQGSQTITENGTYDTTLVDDVTVSVSGSGGTILKWQSTATNQNIGGMKGIVDVYGIELDFNNFTQIIHTPSYFAFKNTTDGTFVLKNIPSGLTDSQKGLSDFLRQAPVFSEIDMGGLAPSWMTRWLYQWNYNSPNNQFHSGTITIRNLCLDSLTGASNSFQAAQNQRYYRMADIYWTGELKNSVSITDWNMLNADSWNRLIEHLYDYSSGEAHTLTVGNTILGLIDSTHQALASSRGWTLA